MTDKTGTLEVEFTRELTETVAVPLSAIESLYTNKITQTGGKPHPEEPSISQLRDFIQGIEWEDIIDHCEDEPWPEIVDDEEHCCHCTYQLKKQEDKGLPFPSDHKWQEIDKSEQWSDAEKQLTILDGGGGIEKEVYLGP